MTGRQRRAKDEAGAYAILFAIMALVMMTIAALAVDIGNAVARKSDVQGQADFAALAAGRASDGSLDVADKTAIYAAAADSLNNNSPQNRPCTDTACVTAGDLSDGVLTNGEVTFPDGDIKVTAPRSRVDYGFARVIGMNSQDVQGTATVGLFSPGVGTLPMYAVDGCDYGPQTLTDPANGPAAAVAPAGLAEPTDNANASLNNIVSPNPAQVPYQDPPAAGPALSLSGSDFKKKITGDDASVTLVGFFRSNGDVVTATVAQADVTDTSVSIPAIPPAVTSVEDLWWIRVFKQKVSDFATSPAVGEWTSVGTAQPLRVGNALLDCGTLSNQGNFGTLTVPREDVVPADDLHVNIVEGPDAPLTLGIHASYDPVTGRCTAGTNGAIGPYVPGPGPNPGTNCVDTLTGLPAGAATSGFVSGTNTSKGFIKGRLNGGDHPTDTSCGRNNYTVDLGPNDYVTNNDILSCYLTNGQTLASVAIPGYAGGAAFEDDMYLSPRFAYVPVLAVDPYTGGAGTYSIKEFRPVFITDEGGTSYPGNSTVTADNGLITQTTQIKQVKVFFFNMAALPASTPGPVTDYIPGAPKIVRLID